MAEEPLPRGIIYFPPARVVTLVHQGNLGAAVVQAVSYEAAAAQGVEPDIILVRDDRWSLGARWEDARGAYRTWPDDWVFFAYREGTPSSESTEPVGSRSDRWRIARLETFRPLVERVLAASPPRRSNDKGGNGR